MADNSPLEQFKQVLTGTSRAIAHDPEIELAFTADAPTQAGRNFRVPMPGRSLPPEQVAEARGFADSFALRLKHHDAARHATLTRACLSDRGSMRVTEAGGISIRHHASSGSDIQLSAAARIGSACETMRMRAPSPNCRCLRLMCATTRD